MAVSAEVYFRISDALGTLRDLLDQGFMFLVPSGPDEEMLLEILLDAKPALDERPRVLRWKDLYRIIQREAPAPGIPRVSRILDPADRYLVVRWLTAGLPKQKDRCPSWIGDPLFPELAASHMVEFMREEVTQKHLFVANGCESCESCPLDSPERVLCRLFCSYQEYLRNARMADETEIPTLTRQALEAAASPPPVKLAVVGFMSFTHGQLNLLRKMIALGMELHFLFPWISLEGFNDGASQLGLSPNHPPEPLRPPRVFQLTGIDPKHQYELLAREISLLGTKDSSFPLDIPLDQVAISVPTEDLRALASQLERYRVPFWIQGGSPITDTQPMGLLRLCGEAASSGWEFLPTMRLVSSVMEIDLEKLMTQQPRGLAPWREFIRSQCGEDAERRFRRLADFGALLLKGATPMRLLEEALAVMKAADPERMSEAVKDMHNLDWTVRAVTSSIEEMEKKIFSLSEGLDLLGQAFQDPLNLRDAMEFLGIWGSSSYTVQDQPLDGAVRVYRDAPPVLAEHRLFVLCGADQSRWPGKLSESPMMGEPYRERVNSSFLERPDLTPTHLVSLHERRKAKEAMFIRMALAGRDAFVLTQGATDKDGRPVPPTPFARSLREMGAPAEDVNGPGDLLPSERFIRGVEFPRHPAPSWEEAGTTTYVVKVSPDEGGGKRRLPLSGLDSFVKCPFRYACENLLKIKPPERKPVPRFLLGELAHEAMKIASSRPNMSSPEEILDKVKALPSAEPILKPGRGRYLQRLSDMIGRGIDWLGARKKGLEENGLRLICSITEATLPGIEMDNHIGTGRADLVDVIECQGVRGYVILDFKTGFSSDYKDSLQVAAYAKALKAASSGEGIKELKGAKLLGFGFLSFSDMLDHLRWNSFTSEKSKSPNKDNCIGIMWTSRDGLGTPNLIQGAYRLYQPKGTTGDNAEEGSGGSKAGRDPIYAEDMISKASQAMEDLDEALRNGSFEAKHRYYTIRRDVCSKCPYGDLCRRLEAGHDFEEEQEGGEGDEL